MKLSLVIPCYNEAANLPILVPRCRAVCEAGDNEVVLVDNGSSDFTPAILKDLLAGVRGIRHVRIEQNMGYGFGILCGLRAARGDILAWTHADLQTDPLDAVRGLSLFDKASDPTRLFVKGRRRDLSIADTILTLGLSTFETVLLRCPLFDIGAQPTMFPRAFFKTWHKPPYDFSLDLYAYYLAKRAGLELARFPVRFCERINGVSHRDADRRDKGRSFRHILFDSLKLYRRTSG